MKNLRATCIALTILSIATFSFASLNDASANEEADVRQAATQFYKALNTMFTGDVGPMLEAWSHRNDITYMGPAGGLLVGWGDVEKSWRDQAAMKLGGTVLPKKTHVQQYLKLLDILLGLPFQWMVGIVFRLHTL